MYLKPQRTSTSSRILILYLQATLIIILGSGIRSIWITSISSPQIVVDNRFAVTARELLVSVKPKPYTDPSLPTKEHGNSDDPLNLADCVAVVLTADDSQITPAMGQTLTQGDIVGVLQAFVNGGDIDFSEPSDHYNSLESRLSAPRTIDLKSALRLKEPTVANGNIVHNIPSVMTKGEPCNIHVGIGEMGAQALAQAFETETGVLPTQGGVVDPVTDTMSVTLASDPGAFTITSVDSETQAIIYREMTTWNFSVLPVEDDTHYLYLVVTAHLKTKGGTESKDVISYQQAVKVDVSEKDQAAAAAAKSKESWDNFFEGAKFVATLVGGGGIAGIIMMIYNVKGGKKEKDDGDDDDSDDDESKKTNPEHEAPDKPTPLSHKQPDEPDKAHHSAAAVVPLRHDKTAHHVAPVAAPEHAEHHPPVEHNEHSGVL